MIDDPNNAEALRARLDHHLTVTARAEIERAELIAAKAEAGALLTDGELDEVDTELARLSDVIERAATRIGVLKPALVAAEQHEADAERMRNTAGAAARDRTAVTGMAEIFGERVASEAAARLKAAAIDPKSVNPRLFDLPPAPKMLRDDASWWAAREARERAERETRLQSMSAKR